MRLIFDLESDNLLDKVTKIYCICTYDIDSKESKSFRPDEIEAAIEYLAKAETLIGHNIINYDLAVIEKLFGQSFYRKHLVDTLLLSKLFNADIQNGHSLAAWGERFKFPKGDYHDWSAFSEDMLTYCEQDVRVTAKVYDYLAAKIDIGASYVLMEHRVAVVQHYQEMRGVMFDKQLCLDTLNEINNKIAVIEEGVKPFLGMKPTNPYSTTMKPFKKDGSYTKSCVEWFDTPYDVLTVMAEFSRIEWVEITLATEKLLKERLIALGWKPTMLTPTGQPKLAEKGVPCENLLAMGDNFAAIGEYQILKHRKGLLEGLLQVVREDGAIPSEGDTLGAATGRYTHRKIVNMPAVRSPYGEVIRAMFKAREGYKFVGVDLAGIEARMLAHYMNDADFTDIILNGDIHTFNQIKAGLPTRDAAKTFFYGLIYGAGDEKVGQLVNGGQKQGKKIKADYFAALPSLKNTVDRFKKEAASGFITSLDGRKIRVRKDQFTGEFQTHKALNTLLQSSATIYFKTWMLFVDKAVKASKIDCFQLISMHDELQFECTEKDIDKLKEILEDCIVKTDKYYKVNCSNACEVKFGNNWKDTH